MGLLSTHIFKKFCVFSISRFYSRSFVEILHFPSFLQGVRQKTNPLSHRCAMPDSPFCRCATSVPLFVTCGDISPRRGENLSRPGEAVLWDGAFDTPENFAAMPKAPSLRELVRRKPRLREFPLDISPLLHYNTSKMNHSKMKGQTCCEPEYRIFHQDRAGVQCRL